MDAYLQAALTLWRLPEVQKVAGVFTFLCSINAMFWLLARAAGALMHIFSELFLEELWAAVEALYYVVLGVFFTAVLFVAATRLAPAKDLFWRQGAGFVLLYLALSGAYMDPKTHELTEESRPGFWAGLAAYLVFSLAPTLTARPELPFFIDFLKALARGWVGTALTVGMVLGLLRSLAVNGLSLVSRLLAPVLWMTGLSKAPPIQLRHDEAEETQE